MASTNIPPGYRSYRGNRTAIPRGKILGRQAPGDGPVELLNQAQINRTTATANGGPNSPVPGGMTGLSGDVTTTPGIGVRPATIANDAVTYAKMQNMATDRLLGRDTPASGNPEEISVGGGLEFTGSGGIQRSALTGDVTASVGSNATTIAADAVTYAKMQNISAASRLLGRGSAAGAGDTQEITLGSGLTMTGTVLDAPGGGGSGITQLTGDVTAGPGSGSQAATIANDAVTYAKMQNVSAISRLLGRGSAAGTGDVEEIALGTGLLMTGTTLSSTGGGRETLTANRTYYVRTDGSDSNTGLVNSSGGAFLTIQKAVDTAAALDCSIYDLTIQVGNGTYTGQTTLKAMLGSGTFLIVGDTTTPANVVISTTSAHCFIWLAGTATWNVRGVKMQTTTSGWAFVVSGAGAVIRWESVDFGACASGHATIQRNALGWPSGAYTVSGSAPYHIASLIFGTFTMSGGLTVTLSGTPAFSSAFLASQYGSFLQPPSSFSGTATGKRYDVTDGGIIFSGLAETSLPGSIAGTRNTGGIYCGTGNPVQDLDDLIVSAASRIVGRGSAGGAGSAEEITVGSGLRMSGTTLDAGNITLNAQNGTYTLVLADAGKMVRHNSASAHTHTVPPSSSVAWTAGDTVTFANKGGGVLTIAQGSGVTLRLAGSATTGNRSLAANSVCTAVYIDTDEWLVGGAGLT